MQKLSYICNPFKKAILNEQLFFDLKKIVLLSLLMSSCILALAQSGLGYQPFSIGVGGGITTAIANTKTIVNKNAFDVSLTYNYTPFFTFSAEGQVGTLAGGSPNDYSGRAFINSYKAILFHADLQTGEYVNYHNSTVLNTTKNIYYGTGIGFINNNITDIQPVIPRTGGNFYYPYYQQSTNLVIPLRAGYDLKIFNAYDEPQYHIDFSYSFNMVLGDGLDGYANLSNFKFYGLFALSFKYCFGPVNLYKKPIDFTHF